MKTVLLDTHVLLWWTLEPSRLTQRQRARLRKTSREGRLAISVITLWEIAKLASKHRIQLGKPLHVWLQEIEQEPELAILPLSAAIIAESVQLGQGVPPDPADQLIVATARCHALPLVTSDKRIREWGGVSTI